PMHCIKRHRLSFPTRRSSDLPGTDWAYANPNYWILAWLVEEVSGVDFETYVHQEILEPLGMSETSLASTGAQVPGVFGHAFEVEDRKSTRLNSSHVSISYAVF